MKIRRIKLKDEKIDEWTLIPYVFVDENEELVGYNFQCMRKRESGFVEFIRFDLHRKGKIEEDSPHLHIRLESKNLQSDEEAKEKIVEIIKLLPAIEKVIR